MPNRSNRSSGLNFSKIMRNIIQLSFSEKMASIEIDAKNVIIIFGIRIQIRRSVVIVIVLVLMDLLEKEILIIRDIL